MWLPEEPAVIKSGKGCRVKDADGREFIDFRNALGPITLGYAYEPVNAVIRAQLDDGVLFGYPHILEAEVAELLAGIIPGADRVRFLKTGGEAIAACIKIARYATRRDHVIQIGYNGWLNSLSVDGVILPGRTATGTVPGVPAILSALHHNCKWNDLDQLNMLGEKFGGELAAIVVAADYDHMEQGTTFYPILRKFADRYGALLIFDEIVTGFRIALGGIGEYFKVIPDLAVFAKGIANGMPLSVYAGKAKYMDMLDQAIVSSTYGGEALSLAAAKKVIEIYQNEPVIEHLWKMGEMMWGGMDALFKKCGIPAKMGGHRPVSFYHFLPDSDPQLPERFVRAVCKSGVTLYRGGYVNYSHRESDISEALEKIEKGLLTL
jgi:glutamate-1-semialdehyde 2,1-aminomutase